MTERGVKAVICGPGSLAQAHTIDEFTTEEQVRKAQEFYEALLKKYLIKHNWTVKIRI